MGSLRCKGLGLGRDVGLDVDVGGLVVVIVRVDGGEPLGGLLA
jgi:hypothetical protein